MRRRAVLGTPISSLEKIRSLRGHSFCVSFFHRQKVGAQLNEIVQIVGSDEILLLDNGAFSLYTKSGLQMDNKYLVDYAVWAKDILDRCPQAVWVVPDKIGASWEENDALEDLFDRLCKQNGIELAVERSMRLWHLDEPIEKLTGMVSEGVNFIGLGSSGQYWNPSSSLWKDRMAEAFEAVDATCRDFDCARPWIHLMRAQSQAPNWPVESSDSTNVAVNAHRHKARLGEDFCRLFAEEVMQKSTRDAFGIDRVHVCLPRQAAAQSISVRSWKEQQRIRWAAYKWFKAAYPETPQSMDQWLWQKGLELAHEGATREEVRCFFSEFGCEDEVGEFAFEHGLWEEPMPWLVQVEREMRAMKKKKQEALQRRRQKTQTRQQMECLF